jgi:hypothetical protein
MTQRINATFIALEDLRKAFEEELVSFFPKGSAFPPRLSEAGVRSLIGAAMLRLKANHGDDGMSIYDKPLPKPERLCEPKPMTSFIGGLSKEKLERLMAYRGPESHGK